MKTKKKRNPRSEAAMREAIKNRNGLIWRFYTNRPHPLVKAMCSSTLKTVAEFDLRDCYRLRSPLKGIKKAMAKAIQPKRKRK